MTTHRFLSVACAATVLLVSVGAFADLTDDERKCSDAFNKAARNVANQEQKANRQCVKHGNGDVSACVDPASGKAAIKELKIEELFQTGGKCDPNAAFGVNSSGTPLGDDAGDTAESGSDDIIRSIWGNPPNGVVAESKCADSVAKRTGKIYDTILKAFRKCAQNAGTIASISTLENCVVNAILDAKVAVFDGKLSQDVTSKCDTLPEPGTEDGACGGEGTAAGYAACATRVAKCNACMTLNAITGGNATCDNLDNGSVDDSCGDAPAHKCTFDSAIDNSSAQICFLGVCVAPLDISGALDIICAPAAQDGNGKRPCQAELQTFSSFVLPGVGTICVDPASPCPDGEIDCDGGNALDLDLVADHEIGACSGNADCNSQCTTYCGGLSKTVYASGCESFCQLGTRADLPCICDLASGVTCVGGTAGVNDCPGGSCEGKDNEPDISCHCTCIDDAAGGPSPPGGAQIRLGLAIRVEQGPPCDNTDVLIPLLAQCAPLTTGNATVVQLDANEDGFGTQGPWSESGVAGSCANFDTSVTADFELVSTLAFMDSTIGDLQMRLSFDCH